MNSAPPLLAEALQPDMRDSPRNTTTAPWLMSIAPPPILEMQPEMVTLSVMVTHELVTATPPPWGAAESRICGTHATGVEITGSRAIAAGTTLT